jgi:hypothetical protein
MTISQRPQVSCILADLDDTCYENTAMQHHVADNIRRESRQAAVLTSPAAAARASCSLHAPLSLLPPLLVRNLGCLPLKPTPRSPSPPAGYMAERLEIPADEVAEKCADYYLNYGTTLAGLVAHGHKIDYDDWHASVHGSLPYEQYLKVSTAVQLP